MITSRDLKWSWQDRDVVLGLDEAGAGVPVLLFPALSSIFTRGEMRPLMERLAGDFRVVATDWPGFGRGARPALHWTHEALSAFLHFALQALADITRGEPTAMPPQPRIVAAGHAATYLLHYAASIHPDAIERIANRSSRDRGFRSVEL